MKTIENIIEEAKIALEGIKNEADAKISRMNQIAGLKKQIEPLVAELGHTVVFVSKPERDENAEKHRITMLALYESKAWPDIIRTIAYSPSPSAALQRLREMVIPASCFSKDQIAYFPRKGLDVVLSDKIIDSISDYTVFCMCGHLKESRKPPVEHELNKLVSSHPYRQKLIDAFHLLVGCDWVSFGNYWGGQNEVPVFEPMHKQLKHGGKRPMGNERTVFMKALMVKMHVSHEFVAYVLTLFSRLEAENFGIVRVRANLRRAQNSVAHIPAGYFELTDFGMRLFRSGDIGTINAFATIYANIFEQDPGVTTEMSTREAEALAANATMNMAYVDAARLDYQRLSGAAAAAAAAGAGGNAGAGASAKKDAKAGVPPEILAGLNYESALAQQQRLESLRRQIHSVPTRRG